MDFDNNENNSTSGNDNRGKFSDRIKKIRRDRLKLRKSIKLEDDFVEEHFLKRWFRNVFKIVLALPPMVYHSLKSENNTNDLKKSIDGVEDNYHIGSVEQVKINKRIKINKIREMDVALLQKQKEVHFKNQQEVLKEKELLIQKEIYIKKQRAIALEEEKEKEQQEYLNNIKNGNENFEKEQKIKILQKEIIDLIKKKLVKNINELEVLQSELYLLKELSGEDIYYKKCHEDIKEIKKLLLRIKSLKGKYDYLKESFDFDYMLQYGDDLLVDKILELKELCSHDDIKYVVDNFKILEEYKYLYLKIDKLQDSTIKYDDYKKEKEKELKDRDIDFDKLKSDVYDVSKENERYNIFVKEQDRFLRNLDDKISKIDSHERVTYKLKGFNKLLGNSFKYLGLMLVNPLKGFIPGIAVQTVATRNVIHNLYNNLEWQENRKMVYEAVDYSTSLNIAMNNLDDTLSMVNATMDDIVRLKNKYINDFAKYQYSFSSYQDAIKKINKMENAILGNKLKIELMQQRMKEKERQNREKMQRVKKLNSSANN